MLNTLQNASISLLWKQDNNRRKTHMMYAVCKFPVQFSSILANINRTVNATDIRRINNYCLHETVMTPFSLRQLPPPSCNASFVTEAKTRQSKCTLCGKFRQKISIFFTKHFHTLLYSHLPLQASTPVDAMWSQRKRKTNELRPTPGKEIWRRRCGQQDTTTAGEK